MSKTINSPELATLPPLVLSTLLTPLSFIDRQTTALAIFTTEQAHLVPNDILCFVPEVVTVRVVSVNGNEVEVARGRPVPKRRELGGVKYRRWERLDFEDYPEGELPPTPKHRPLVRMGLVWQSIHLPPGTQSFVYAHGFIK